MNTSHVTLPELPALHWLGCAPTPTGRVVSLATEDSINARERIFLAEIERLRAEAEAMRADAAMVAAIAHESGLVGYDETEALADIRAMTVRHFNKTGTRGEAMERVKRAINTADAARGQG